MDPSGDLNKPKVMGYPSMNKNYPPPPQIPPPGYPMAYHGAYYPPYQGYPSAPSSKHFASPSFNMMYGGQNYAPWLPEHNNNNVHKFGRLMLATMIILLIIMCMVTLVVWFLFGTEIPEFQVSAISVSNLNVSDRMISANWAVNLTVLNPNSNLKVNSGSVKLSIIYKNVPLAMTSSNDPFFVEGNQSHDLNFKMDNVKTHCQKLVASELRKDMSSGTTFVSIRFYLGAKFASTTIWKNQSLKVFCEDLKVDLPSNSTGTLAQDSPKECYIYT